MPTEQKPISPIAGFVRCPALLAVVLAMHAIVFYNACRHDPDIGYDGREHIAYIHALTHGRLPTTADSREFFSPPLAYALPAGLMAVGIDEWHALKAAQFLQALASLGLVYFLAKICEIVFPERDKIKIATIGLLAMLPVYYKSFAMIRGEPWVACFGVIAIYYASKVFAGFAPPGISRAKDAVALGIVSGLLLLSRQWGVLVLLGIVPVAVIQSARSPRLFRGLLLAVVIAIAMSAWFYLHLFLSHGSVLAFNRPTSATTAQTQSIALTPLFTDPIKDSLKGRPVEIFYAETWGDYWCFFLAWGREQGSTEYVRAAQIESKMNEPGFETNRFRIAGYLGRVNLLGGIPSVILLLGFVWGTARVMKGEMVVSLFICVIAVSIAGYLWFVHRTATTNFDTIKSTYLLQIFPLLAMLGGGAVDAMTRNKPRLRMCVWGALIVIAAHNLPACLTRYYGG